MPDERLAPSDAVYRTEDTMARPMPDTFFGLLDVIRERPGMYLGRKSVELLQVLLLGIKLGRAQVGLPPLPDHDEWHRFDDFVCDKYRWHDVGGWAAKIAYYYRDDARALEEFFKLVDEFRAAKQPTTRNP